MNLSGGFLGAFRRNKHKSANKKRQIALIATIKQEDEAEKQEGSSWFMTATAVRRRSDLQAPLFTIADDGDDPTEDDTTHSSGGDDDEITAPAASVEPQQQSQPQQQQPQQQQQQQQQQPAPDAPKKKKKEKAFELNPWFYIHNLPSYKEIQPSTPPVVLPPKSASAPPITLVLDLDETLVHSSVDPVENADMVIDVEHRGKVFPIYVLLRPFLFEFLEAVYSKYEIVVFTASRGVYADKVLDRLDPDGKYFHHRLFRESCLPYQDTFVKDLNMLGRDLSKTILVDNSPHTFGYQLDNGVPIKTWLEDPSDTELPKLEQFLQSSCVPADDVRTVLRDTYGCQQLVENAAIEAAAEATTASELPPLTIAEETTELPASPGGVVQEDPPVVEVEC